MGWSEVGAILLGLGGFLTGLTGWLKTRRDAKREGSTDQRSQLDLHLERQDKEIERQAAEITQMRSDHRMELLAIQRRQDFWEVRVREMFDYAYVLRQHISDGKPPPPPAWPDTLLNVWRGDIHE